MTEPKLEGYASDVELAGKIAAGDEEALQSFLSSVHGKAIGKIRQILKSAQDEEEDIFQEAAFKFHKWIGRYRGEAALTSYFIRIAINEALMKYRKDHADKRQKLIRAGDLTEEDEHALFLNSGDKGAQGQSKLTRLAVNQVLKSLPAGYRTVLVLHDIHGFQHGEIANLLEISEGTSKSQLSRARQKFREAYSLRASL